MDFDIMTFLFTQIFTACGLFMAVISFIICSRGKAGMERMSRHTTGRVIRNEAVNFTFERSDILTDREVD